MKKHITALDGLRGIAILLVLFTHLLPHRAASSAFLRVLNGFAGIGWSGVDVFFVLSGFLITGILFDSKASNSYFKNFYMRRTLRIMPLYFLLVSCCILVFPHFAATQGSAPATHRWMFWVYLSNVLVAFRGAVSVGWLGPLWSLAVEEHFYLIWPAVILLCSRKVALRVCAGSVVLAAVSRFWFLSHHNLLGPYVFTFSRIDELALGGAVALVLRGPADPTMVRRVAVRAGAVAGCVTGVLFVWRHGVILDPVMLAFGLPAVGCLATAMLTLAVLPDGPTPWKRLLNARVLRQFGRYSYGLYMLHMPVWELLTQHHLLFPASGRIQDLANMLLATGVSFTVAFLSFHLFERRFLALKRFYTDGEKLPNHTKTKVARSEPASQRLSLEVRP